MRPPGDPVHSGSFSAKPRPHREGRSPGTQANKTTPIPGTPRRPGDQPDANKVSAPGVPDPGPLPAAGAHGCVGLCVAVHGVHGVRGCGGLPWGCGRAGILHTSWGGCGHKKEKATGLGQTASGKERPAPGEALCRAVSPAPTLEQPGLDTSAWGTPRSLGAQRWGGGPSSALPDGVDKPRGPGIRPKKNL